ncbi:MAG TPA: hypothetical protein VMV37_05045, partial [Gammaproteobacteria bacterium]|nr:hypothetical protein [Gammaproteobacteria bacterium]
NASLGTALKVRKALGLKFSASESRVAPRQNVASHKDTSKLLTPAGGVQQLIVTCKSATEQLEYRPNSEWTIPDDYGACWLQVDATSSTAFTLYEFE